MNQRGMGRGVAGGPHGQMTVAEAGRKGGETTSREHGPEFYHEIGTKGGQRVRALIQAGKAAEMGGGRKSR